MLLSKKQTRRITPTGFFSFTALFRLAGAERPVRPNKILALPARLLNNAVRTGLTVWYLKCHV